MDTAEKRVNWLPVHTEGPKDAREGVVADVAFSILLDDITDKALAAGCERLASTVPDTTQYDISVTANVSNIENDEDNTATVTTLDYERPGDEPGGNQELIIKTTESSGARYHSGFGNGPVETESLSGPIDPEKSRLVGAAEIDALGKILLSNSVRYSQI
ncbi:MAG TPA: hypothetical protein VFB59_00045 [Candidatus Saccharimonadales bacterium]|nr:hypothetical protein [Candidatus Saccharimonadales bacterium]